MAERGKARAFSQLLREIRACRICAASLPHEPRPIIRASLNSKLCIIGQAPGLRVHQSGLSFDDPSGDRLRDWLGVTKETFYDEQQVAIVGMGFCFPGYNAHGSDLPPRKECAPAWHPRLFELLGEPPLTLLIGGYAQKRYLGPRARENMTETVRAWRSFTPRYIPLPHPSWRNNAWLKNNPWFGEELLPYLRKRVRHVLSA